MLGMAGVVAVDGTAYATTDAHAQAAADAAAHAAEAAVIANEDVASLSLAAQAGAVSCESLTDSRCAEVVDAARSVATMNGGQLVAVRLGPDLRDRKPGVGAGRLTVIVEVAVFRRLGLPGVRCARSPGATGDLCWAVAWSAAEQVAAPVAAQ